MQGRLGPMQAPAGMVVFQPIADAVKFLLKEDIIPAKADKMVFIIAPIIMLIMAFGAFVAMPFGPDDRIFSAINSISGFRT